MTRGIALVTGAAGFVGSRVVERLASAGRRVRAGIRSAEDAPRLAAVPGVEPVRMDLRDAASVRSALAGVREVLHFAAVVSGTAPARLLYETNAEGTERLCREAGAARVERFLYCSTTAVYGLHSRRFAPVSEEILPRPFEPYGASKLRGEEAARDLAARTGAAVVLLRPTAVLGRGERSAYGERLRRAAATRILLPGAFARGSLSWVHVDDVAGSAVHLLGRAAGTPQTFNVAVDPPIPYADAFRAWIRSVSRLRPPPPRVLALGRLSQVCSAVGVRPGAPGRRAFSRFGFLVWRPGFDITYSGRKLLGTGYRFAHRDLSRVLLETYRPRS